jgi:hypothetical protein
MCSREGSPPQPGPPQAHAPVVEDFGHSASYGERLSVSFWGVPSRPNIQALSEATACASPSHLRSAESKCQVDLHKY